MKKEIKLTAVQVDYGEQLVDMLAHDMLTAVSVVWGDEVAFYDALAKLTAVQVDGWRTSFVRYFKFTTGLAVDKAGYRT